MARAAVLPYTDAQQAQALEYFTHTVPNRRGRCKGKIYHAKRDAQIPRHFPPDQFAHPSDFTRSPLDDLGKVSRSGVVLP